MDYHALNRHWLWKRPVRVFGHRFQAPTLDRLASLWLHKLGILGRFEIRLLRRLVSTGMTVIDVGANQGIYTLLLADLARPGPVFAFEPEPMLYQQLVANVRENKTDNVVCHPIAISRSSGRLMLQPGKMHTGNNRIVQPSQSDGITLVEADLPDIAKASDFAQGYVRHDVAAFHDVESESLTRFFDRARRSLARMRRADPGTRPGQKGCSIEVTAASLDELFPHTRVDFLKMDVQGWEAEAFAGAKEVLQRNRDILLMFEFWPYGLRIAGTEPADLLMSLTRLGFSLWRIKNGALSALEHSALPDPAKEFAYCDVLAARRTDLAAFGRGRSPS
jgi:FkbM family methyltransferase